MAKFSESHLLIQDTIHQFAQAQIAPHSQAWDKAEALPASLVHQLAELGLLAMLVPESYGGAELDLLSYAIAIEEVAAADASCSTFLSVTNSVVCLPIFHYGSEDQKQQWLPKIAQGEIIGCFCLTEPEAGSDASNLRSTASKTEHGYTLNGVKQFITNGKEAELALVFACTDKLKGKQGLSAFLVPMDLPGVSVSTVEKKMGQRASSTVQLFFDNVELSVKALLGQDGQGYPIALSSLESGRIGIAAQCVGIAKAAFELARNYAGGRKTFGKHLTEHDVIRFQFAEMATDIEAARQLLYSAADKKDQQKPATKEAAMAKLYASEMVERVCSRAMQVLGGYGYLSEYRIEQLMRDARVAQIYEGTSEIQKMIIAKSILD